MKPNIVIIGGSYGISKKIAEGLEPTAEVFTFSRSKSFDVLNDQLPLNDLPDVIDGVVYAPGTIKLKPFQSLKIEDFEDDFKVNALGAVKILQALYPRLKNSQSASVVLFSTVAVQKGMPYHASISMAKGAIEGLVRSLAIEWAPKIRVNAIAPSLTDTPLAAKITGNAKALEVTTEKHPLKRIGRDTDIAEMALFLLSSKSSWITGQVLPVDGGLSIA
jgi:NAD(P)-dependent dehydrogenase (short-subunit alcohol dehydrogenase family)